MATVPSTPSIIRVKIFVSGANRSFRFTSSLPDDWVNIIEYEWEHEKIGSITAGSATTTLRFSPEFFGNHSRQYRGRVRVRNAIGYSPFSVWVYFWLPAYIPPPPPAPKRNVSVKIEGTWRQAATSVKVDGTWRDVKVWTKVGGSWSKVED